MKSIFKFRTPCSTPSYCGRCLPESLWGLKLEFRANNLRNNHGIKVYAKGERYEHSKNIGAF